jgi:hypothetical protein
MSHLRSVALVAALCAACTSNEHRRAVPSEPTLDQSFVDGGQFAAAEFGTEPSGDPPPAWVDNPAELDPDIPQSVSNCDLINYPFPATVHVYLHPDAVCRQREWGNSGIVRQQGRRLHVTSLPKCSGGPGDIAEIRLCKVGWANQQTTWGKAGPLGCIGIKIVPTCEA